MGPILERLNQHGARYLVIGGQAIRLEGFPRTTMDWDLFIPKRDTANFALLNEILEDVLDLPLEMLGPRGENFVQTYQTPYGILQFHLTPPGLPVFEEAELRRVLRREEHGIVVPCVCARDLLAAKEAAGREHDQEDILFLRMKLAREEH